MRTPRSAPLVVKILAGTLLAACGVIAACSGTNGVTPDCEFNVGANGIEPNPNGCEQFAPCLDKNGNRQDASKCCVDGNDNPLTGDALALCLFGYGAGPAPTTSASSSSSSSSGGTGGAGGGS
ncbi:MAG: hypothetical protein QM820_50070 [Minicystis sp.]